eukprot:GFUD01099512.1.p1 GENE.GFUD01099512.1~~GFUD01099512.1.p1  ORF type:complete len:183 (-),score=54.42 GFUD01099512.1:175-723(-)
MDRQGVDQRTENELYADHHISTAHASLMNQMNSLNLCPNHPTKESSNHNHAGHIDSLTSTMTDMTMQDHTVKPEDVFLTSMACHTLPLPQVEESQQTIQNLEQQQQQLKKQQEQLEIQLHRMEVEENHLWDKSDQYQKEFAQYQQLLGHQQAQLEMQLHQLALHQKHWRQCQKAILPGSCWM